MKAIRGITTCVGYDDLLGITLRLNMRHMSECLVITSPGDTRTRDVALSVPGVRVFATDAFTRYGARFNKGLAIEEGLDELVRDGRLIIWDADTIFPDNLRLERFRPGCIHGATRRVLDDARAWRPDLDWRRCRAQKDDQAIGFFQLFDAEDLAIKDKRPWYEPTFAHAGGCDDYFIQHWPRSKWVTLPIECLHLGEVATNWYGRASERLDGATVDDAEANRRAMESLIKRFDWHWARPGIDTGSLVDDGAAPHRVDVPGVGPSHYEVPFARRSKEARPVLTRPNPAIRGITISVGYSGLLAITLPRNMRHFAECIVVTSPEDERTQAVARSVPGVRLHITDAFTRHGAAFNKGLGMEEGFDALGREGWILIHDADILLPDDLMLDKLRPDTLHGAHRRLWENPATWKPGSNWVNCPHSRDGGPIGFFQLFDAGDPAIRDKRPWYDVSFAHAGGGDAFFMTHWDPGHRIVLPLDVLHLGPKETHWFGIDAKARDTMQAFILWNGWDRSHPRVDRTAPERVGEIKERVEVPGYEPSGFELPLVKRAQRFRKAGG